MTISEIIDQPANGQDDEMPETSSELPAPLILPVWTPQKVAFTIRWIEVKAMTEIHRAILTRLATDGRMRDVWTELTKRNRATGSFFHLAKIGTRSDGATHSNQEEAQADALGRLFHVTFRAACDEMTVTKDEQIRPVREKLLSEALLLREIAADLALTNPTQEVAEADAAALRRVADWREAGARALRTTDDPLTIQNDRGDRIVRGVQIIIGSQIQDFFGKRLDGIAATLTSVALEKQTSSRVTRSAFSLPKPA